MTNDGVHSYTYDAENGLVSVDGGATAQYKYDHQNRRVTKIVGSAWTHYIWEGAQVISEHDATTAYSTNPTYQVKSARLDYVYAGGRMIHSRQRTSSTAPWTTQYYLSDRLSVRMTLDLNANVLGRQAHLPFGEDFSESGTQEKHHFTSYERDSESGADYAVNRQYSQSVGRFNRVDPLASSARLAAPQSWNRYSYAHNEPMNQIDPLGLDIPGPGPSPGEPPHPPGNDPRWEHEHGPCPAWQHDCEGSGFSFGWTISPGSLLGGGIGELGGGGGFDFGFDPGPAACPADKRRFFDWLADSLATMAQDLNTTLALLLTLAAKEGGWTTASLNHNQPLNNPFGVNRIRRGRAVGNVHYPSLAAAIQYWEATFGDRVRGAQSVDAFINGLQHPATGSPYNSADPKYEEKFRAIYGLTLRFMSACGVQP